MAELGRCPGTGRLPAPPCGLTDSPSPVVAEPTRVRGLGGKASLTPSTGEPSLKNISTWFLTQPRRHQRALLRRTASCRTYSTASLPRRESPVSGHRCPQTAPRRGNERPCGQRASRGVNTNPLNEEIKENKAHSDDPLSMSLSGSQALGAVATSAFLCLDFQFIVPPIKHWLHPGEQSSV